MRTILHALLLGFVISYTTGITHLLHCMTEHGACSRTAHAASANLPELEDGLALFAEGACHGTFSDSSAEDVSARWACPLCQSHAVRSFESAPTQLGCTLVRSYPPAISEWTDSIPSSPAIERPSVRGPPIRTM
ncbi:MAG: hypothetical protein QM518_04790 [Verrucomicrobiota bacterium]|nr:hypothetical protein [Verrucomicrobiota bacterium]